MRCGKYIDETCSKAIIVELGFDYENIEKCFYESFLKITSFSVPSNPFNLQTTASFLIYPNAML